MTGSVVSSLKTVRLSCRAIVCIMLVQLDSKKTKTWDGGQQRKEVAIRYAKRVIAIQEWKLLKGLWLGKGKKIQKEKGH